MSELSGTRKRWLLTGTTGGTLHGFFEGYFVLNYATLGESQSLFAQLWKEYSLSDSRYLTGDPTVLCAEAITVFVWGPLCYIAAILILISSPYRHPAQITVSLAHLYGDALYISTSLVDLYVRQVSYSRPEPYYFWFYFLFLNAIWIFVPACKSSTTRLPSPFSHLEVLLYQSITAIGGAFLISQRLETMGKDASHVQFALQGTENR